VSDLLKMVGAEPDRSKETEVFIYVFGVVRYHDGFTEGRTTKFCHRYNWKMRSQFPGNYGMKHDLARLHTYGNQSD
jgi:hypothetical protein